MDWVTGDNIADDCENSGAPSIVSTVLIVVMFIRSISFVFGRATDASFLDALLIAAAVVSFYRYYLHYKRCHTGRVEHGCGDRHGMRAALDRMPLVCGSDPRPSMGDPLRGLIAALFPDPPPPLPPYPHPPQTPTSVPHRPPPHTMSDYAYTDESHPLLRDVVCFVCQNPPIAPVRVIHTHARRDCGALVCQTCYLETPTETPTACCPLCRQPVQWCDNPREVAPDAVAMRLLATVPVRCVHCDAHMALENVRSHGRTCLPSRIATLERSHDWSIPGSECLKRDLCADGLCVWLAQTTDLLERAHGDTDAMVAAAGFMRRWVWAFTRRPRTVRAA